MIKKTWLALYTLLILLSIIEKSNTASFTLQEIFKKILYNFDILAYLKIGEQYITININDPQKSTIQNYGVTNNVRIYGTDQDILIDELERSISVSYCNPNNDSQSFPYEIETVLSFDGKTKNYARTINENEFIGTSAGQISLTQSGTYDFILIGFKLAQNMIKDAPFPRIDLTIPGLGIVFTLYGLQINQFDVPDVKFTLPEQIYDMVTGEGSFPLAGLINSSLILGTDYSIVSKSFIGKIFEDNGYLELILQNLNLTLEAGIFTSGEYGYSNVKDSSILICPYHFSFGMAPNTEGTVKIGKLVANLIASTNTLVSTIISSLISIFKNFLEGSMSSLLFGSILNMAGNALNNDPVFNQYGKGGLICCDNRFPKIYINKNSINVPFGAYVFSCHDRNKKEIYDRQYIKNPKEVENFNTFFKQEDPIKLEITKTLPKYQALSDFSILWNINALDSTLYLAHKYFNIFSGMSIEKCHEIGLSDMNCPPRDKYTDGNNCMNRIYFNNYLYEYDSDGVLIKTEYYKSLFSNESLFATLLNNIDNSFITSDILNDNSVSYKFFLEDSPSTNKIGPNGILVSGKNVVITVALKDKINLQYTDYFEITCDIFMVLKGIWTSNVMGEADLNALIMKRGIVYFESIPYLIKNISLKRIGEVNKKELTPDELNIIKQQLKIIAANIIVPYLNYMSIPYRKNNDNVISHMFNMFLGNVPLFDFSKDYYRLRYDPLNYAIIVELDFNRPKK